MKRSLWWVVALILLTACHNEKASVPVSKENTEIKMLDSLSTVFDHEAPKDKEKEAASKDKQIVMTDSKQAVLKDNITEQSVELDGKKKEKLMHYKNEITREVNTLVTIRSGKQQPIKSKAQYYSELNKYTESMNEVISTMTTEIDRKNADKQLNKIKDIVANYEVTEKKADTQIKNEKIVNEAKAANENYLESMSMIMTAIETDDKNLETQGYAAFVEGHKYLNNVTSEISAVASVEQPVTVKKDEQKLPETEIYKAETVSSEIPVSK